MAAIVAGSVVHRTFSGDFLPVFYLEQEGQWPKKIPQRKLSIYKESIGGLSLWQNLEPVVHKLCAEHDLDANKVIETLTRNNYIRFTIGYSQLRLKRADGTVLETTREELAKHKSVKARELSAGVQYYPEHPEGRYPAGLSLKLVTFDFEPLEDGLHFAAGAAASGDDIARTVSGAAADSNPTKRSASTPLLSRAANKHKKQ